ncbi:MAG: hypothetical protein HY304_02310, partial [candidate division Zixibacteria bacterium]|nr:hypothetical protein [candidate division Zixibacteria bacterium]
DVLHVDFLHILPTKALRVTVPVRIRGVADGVKNFGGILQHVSRHLEVEAIPADIPDIIDVDVSHLGIGDAVHVRDVVVERVTIVSPGDRTVASVVPPTVLKEAAPAEGVVTEETAAGAPEVIGEKERLEKLAAEEAGKEDKEKEKDKPKEKAKEKK